MAMKKICQNLDFSRLRAPTQVTPAGPAMRVPATVQTSPWSTALKGSSSRIFLLTVNRRVLLSPLHGLAYWDEALFGPDASGLAALWKYVVAL